jgi:hypothetical protein
MSSKTSTTCLTAGFELFSSSTDWKEDNGESLLFWEIGFEEDGAILDEE